MNPILVIAFTNFTAELTIVNNQLMLVMLSIVTRADTTVQNCIHRRAIKSTTVNSCNIVVLECSLRIVSESAIIDNHSSIIIVFYSVNATGKVTAFNCQNRISNTIFRFRFLVEITILKQAGIATLVINGNICNRHSTVIQESVIGVAILNTIFLATVVGTTVQSNCTLVINSSFLMGYIINRTLTVNRQGCTLVNGNGVTVNIRQCLAIQVKCNVFVLCNGNILGCVSQQSNSIAIVSCCNSVSQRSILNIINRRRVIRLYLCGVQTVSAFNGFIAGRCKIRSRTLSSIIYRIKMSECTAGNQNFSSAIFIILIIAVYR